MRMEDAVMRVGDPIARRENVVLRSLRFVVACLLMLVLVPVSAASNSIVGQQLKSITLPGPGATVLGFRCNIEIGDVSSAGYVPVEITLQPTGIFPADRRFVVRLVTEAGDQVPPENGLVVDLPIVAPQGSTNLTFTRFIPKWSAGNAFNVTVLEDGRPLKDYNVTVGDRLPPSGYQFRTMVGEERDDNWVFIDEHDVADVNTLPDIREMFAAVCGMPTSQFSQWGVSNVPGLWLFAKQNNMVSPIGIKELPTDWRIYNNHDVIFLSSTTLKLVGENPAAFGAIRDWVFIGGTVVVYQAGSPKETLEALQFSWTDDGPSKKRIDYMLAERKRSLDARVNGMRDSLKAIDLHIEQLKKHEAAKNSPAVLPPRDESEPVSADQMTNMNAAIEMGMFPSNSYEVNGQTIWLETDLPASIEDRRTMRAGLLDLQELVKSSRVQSKDDLFFQSVGAGMVIGTSASIDDPESVTLWEAIRELLGIRISPMLRRGVDPMIGNRRFDRWLIPGVAQPPVYTFMGLLVGFVVLVGPVAYRKTSKSGRSYLMFAIAPALALMTTFAMFAYGIVSDGFGTVTRVRQLTFIDGASGDGGERIRSTYFAGLRPGDGIRFPADAEVMWYPENMGMSWQDHYFQSPALIGNITIDDKSQRFDSSFLPSREQRQFVVHLPRRGIGRLNLIAAADGEPPSIESSFDFPLRSVLLRDDVGKYWAAEGMLAGGTAIAQPVDPKVASKTYGKMYNDYRPISTTKVTSSENNYSGQVFDLISDTNQSVTAQNVFLDGLFEMQLQEKLQTSGDLENGHFIATADVSKDALATDDVELVESVRYLYGTLP